MRVVVTGGAGFVGSALARRLVADEHEVVVIDNFATGHRQNIAGLDLELVEADVRDFDAVSSAVQGSEVVFHQAALPSVQRSIEDPITTHQVAATGTLNVLLASARNGVRRVVYASSSSVYGDSPQLPKHEQLPTLPRSPYAVAKLAGEQYCRVFASTQGIETVSLRYFNVFGPRQDPNGAYAAVVPRFISALSEGRQITVFGDGHQTRDFTYVDNVVEANLLAAMAPSEASGSALNVACGERIELLDLIKILGETVGKATDVVHLAARDGDIKHSLADVSRASDLIGYRPAVDLAEGLRRTVRWFDQNRHETGAATP